MDGGSTAGVVRASEADTNGSGGECSGGDDRQMHGDEHVVETEESTVRCKRNEQNVVGEQRRGGWNRPDELG